MKKSLYLWLCGPVCAGLSCAAADKKDADPIHSPKPAGIETDWEGENTQEEVGTVVVTVVEYLTAAEQTQESGQEAPSCSGCEVSVPIRKGDTGPDVVVRILCEIAADDPCFTGRLRPHPVQHPHKARLKFVGKHRLLKAVKINGEILDPGDSTEIGENLWVKRGAPKNIGTRKH